MFERRKTTHRMTVVMVFGILSLVWAANAQAVQEQRCVGLGPNCLMSEPLNTNAYTTNNAYYNPGDTSPSDKEGAWEVTSYPIWSPNSTITGATTGDAAFSSLPAGHSLNYVMRTANNWGGSLYTGHNVTSGPNGISSTTFVKRMAFRFYIFYSSDFTFSGEGSCTNGKLFEIDAPGTTGQLIVDGESNGPSNLRALTGWTTPGYSSGFDCCVNGPGPNNGLTGSYWKGHWTRVEVIMLNRDGSSRSDVFIYIKDVTNNGPEYTFVDTTNYNTIPVGPCGYNANILCGWDHVNGGKTPVTLNKWATNLHRSSGCTGYQALSHLMMAGWDTDQGQRIGAASEIEGGGSTTPPAAPTGLKVQ